MKDFSPLEKQLGINFQNKTLLQQAFIHRSYINEHAGSGLSHNERFEFLGDAVLELIVTDYLYATYTDKPEGELTAYRASLVNTIMISDTARENGFDEFLMLSKGEAKDTGKARAYILANTYEAFIGAVYLDQGYESARKFVQATLLPKIQGIVREGLWRDAKSYVQEKSQELESVTPSYKVLNEIGPDHDKDFTVGIYFGKKLIAEGVGKSKQEAETDAARNALKAREWN